MPQHANLEGLVSTVIPGSTLATAGQPGAPVGRSPLNWLILPDVELRGRSDGMAGPSASVKGWIQALAPQALGPLLPDFEALL